MSIGIIVHTAYCA